MQLVHGLRFDNLRGDIYGGVTAAVVALPLALAFGVASGAGAIAGLYGAIFVGFFAALLGGTPAQVSGPTGPMTVVMAAILSQYSNPLLAFTVVTMGGLLMIGFGLLKLGRYITYVPFSVISGFMSGIGCIIIIIQLSPLFGYPSSQQGVVQALVQLPGYVGAPKWQALALGVLTLAVITFWPKVLRKLLPATLAALIVGTLASIALFPAAPIIGEIPRGVPQPHWPMLDTAVLPQMLRDTLILAVLGAIDSLLTSLICDNLTRTHHDSDRELIGQGIGNAVAGLFGGIPGAGATMRSVINIRTGGRTPISGALHALVLLALVLGLAPLAERIPHAVLAGILLKVGFDIIDWKFLKRARTAPSAKVLVMLTVLAVTVLVDLIMAVGIGIIMASMISASQLSKVQMAQLKMAGSDDEALPMTEEERALLGQCNGRLLVLSLSGPFSFGSANDLVRRLSVSGANYPVVLYDFADVPFMDMSVAFAIEQLFEQARDNGQQVLVAGLGGSAVEDLRRMNILSLVPPANLHPGRLEALRHAVRLLAADIGGAVAVAAG